MAKGFRIAAWGVGLGLLAVGIWAWRQDLPLPGLQPSPRHALLELLSRPSIPPILQALREPLSARLDSQAAESWTIPQSLPPVPAQVRVRELHTVAELRAALAQAGPGDWLQLAPGDYPIEQALLPARAGRADAPIVLRGSPGARLRVRGTMGLKLTQPHWVLEGLDFEGDCVRAADCEHALQVAGAAHHLVLRHNRFAEFNAALKINGESGRWPDQGQLLHNRIVNRAARTGPGPVVGVDLVGASDWRIEGNLIAGWAKSGGDRISYAIYLKGGGRGGRVERNLVLCAPRPGFEEQGHQVGISFGGGLTGAAYRRPDAPAGLEHHDGLARGNLILNCNDSSLDVNQSAAITLRANTWLGGGGLQVRGAGASAWAEGNRGSRDLRAFGDAQLEVLAQERPGTLAEALRGLTSP